MDNECSGVRFLKVELLSHSAYTLLFYVLLHILIWINGDDISYSTVKKCNFAIYNSHLFNLDI